MADTKISGLPASTVPLAGTEVLPIVQSSTTKQVSVANLTAGRAVDTLNLSTSGSTSTTPVLGFNASNCNIASGATVANTYLQAVMQNKSATAGASTNWAVSNDLGTDSTYYGEFGMNSSVFSASTPADYFSINNGIYFSGHDGDVSYGSGNGFKTYLAWGTTGQSAHVINATGALGFSTNLGTTPALSGTTGFGTSGQALVSAGSASPPAWGTLGVAGGGTGLTTLTANYIPYGNGTSAFQSASGFTYNGTSLTVSTGDSYFNGVRIGLGGGGVSTNTAMGAGAFNGTPSGGNNSGFGNSVLYRLSSGTDNSAFGKNSQSFTTTGVGNSSFGVSSLNSNNSGNYNASFANFSLYSNTTGVSSSSFGYNSLYSNVTGGSLVAVGASTLYYNTTASNLTAVGNSALQNNTTNVATLGTITGGTGYTNGTYTGVVMTLSSGSTALTYPTATIVVAGGAVTTVTLTSNGVGFKDTTTVLTAPAASIGGTGSGFSVPVATLQSGTSNVAVGYQAGYSNSTGISSTFTGYQAGYAQTTASANSIYGFLAGYAITTGGSNSIYGAYAGNTITNGYQNTIYGYNCQVASANNSNSIVIGFQTTGLGSNTTIIGNSSTTATYNGNNSATWSITSDISIKKNIVSLESCLDIISALRPVEFDYIENDKHDIGFIAQEYQTILPAQVIEQDNGLLGLNQNLTPYLVKALQELNAKFDSYIASHP